MPQVIVPLPKNFTSQEAADTFAAYLMGQNALDPTLFDPKGQHEFGPHYLADSNKWLLDVGNNYWLKENDDGTVCLSCRYDGRPYTIIKAMSELFRAAYLQA